MTRGARSAVKVGTSALVAALAFARIALAQKAAAPAAPAQGPPTLPQIPTAVRPVAVAPVAPPATTRPAWPAIPPKVKVQETILYSKPADAAIVDSIASPDCRHVGCVERNPRGFAVRIDSTASKDLEWVVAHTLRFSPDGVRFAYQTQRQGQMFIIIGPTTNPAAAAESKAYFLVGNPAFSPDGCHTAYWAQAEQGGKVVMVVDGVEQGSYDKVEEAQTTWSIDSKRLAYRAARGRQQFFVIDGKEQPPYDIVLGARFSADGRRIGYRAKRADQAFAVIDGREGPHYEMVAGLTFTTDGHRAAYAAGKGTKQMLVTDDGPPGKPAAKEYLPFDGLGAIAFSKDGRRLAITVENAGLWRAIIDGKQGQTYQGTGPVLFSVDSRRYAYMAARDQRQFMVIDGAEGPPFTTIGNYTFTPDGQHLVYAVVRGEEPLLFVDDHRFAPASLFGISPDSRHIAHAIPHADKRWALALDGAEVGAPADHYDGFPPGSDILFDGPTTIRTIVAREASLIRVEMNLAK